MQEILGSFELFSIAVNDSILSARVNDYIVETICDYLNDMVLSGCHAYVQPLTEKSHVCKELKILAIQYKVRFDDPFAVASMLNIPKSSIA